MDNLLKTTAIVILGTLASVSATAAGGKGLEKRFAELDANKDGTVTHAEMMKRAKSKFDEFDRDGNGFLELSELPQTMPMPERMEKRREKMAEKMKKRAEKRGEEFSDDEFLELMVPPSRLKFVAKLDRDGDERVSLDEFAVRSVRMFKKGDLNGDGAVSLQEAQEARKKHGFKRHKKHRRAEGL